MMWVLLAAAVVLSPMDQAGLAEYGAGWWIVKPVVTGAPCPECAASLGGTAPNAPVTVTVE